MEADGYKALPKHAQVLWINRYLLDEHLTFDDNLYDKLKYMRVLPETMIRDVKVSARLLPETMIRESVTSRSVHACCQRQ